MKIQDNHELIDSTMGSTKSIKWEVYLTIVVVVTFLLILTTITIIDSFSQSSNSGVLSLIKDAMKLNQH